VTEKSLPRVLPDMIFLNQLPVAERKFIMGENDVRVMPIDVPTMDEKKFDASKPDDAIRTTTSR
jgi:hypothetical protein